ncbi:MAG: DUF3305 domain-containing protein [gamma proteobacterium symbiont of Lucinoma myriamae]|nr:DUF3305 domain-containing protein [gamma proteobacterium symbiont of Lucinoma myriamae]MCU7832467.1 DUF3305 domain-containing protein [gamma proteobacterium symbiont of Lucinoma myriamae]
MPEAMALEGAESRLSSSFPVSVIMQKSKSDNVWVDEIWDAIGVTVGEQGDVDIGKEKTSIIILQQEVITQYLNTGFNLELFADECESYYYNLMSSTSRCFIIVQQNEEDVPVPFLVSLSYDAAHSYLEGDEIVYAVDLPPELYRWSEAFILNHYAPEKKFKRKRTNWKQDVSRQPPDKSHQLSDNGGRKHSL